jgi:hypothetical protein
MLIWKWLQKKYSKPHIVIIAYELENKVLVLYSLNTLFFSLAVFSLTDKTQNSLFYGKHTLWANHTVLLEWRACERLARVTFWRETHTYHCYSIDFNTNRAALLARMRTYECKTVVWERDDYFWRCDRVHASMNSRCYRTYSMLALRNSNIFF